MNETEFSALTANGSKEELKRELAFLREARRVLEREDLKVVKRMNLVVAALARLQEEALKC